MAREEAIELLDNLIGMVEDNQNNDYDEAFKMGIKALENQKSIIEELESIKAEIEESFSSSVSDCIYIIDKHIAELKGGK